MRKYLNFASAALVLALAAATLPNMVSAATPVYQAASPKGGAGWSTASAPNGRFVVTYTGDTRSNKEQVAKFAFLRAAEFTQESGFEWFAVMASTVRQVELGSANDVAGRSGAFLSNESAGTGAGSDQSAGGGAGTGNGMIGGGGTGSVNMGPSTGGFGGGDAPPSVLEHWQPKTVPQAVLIIQMGKGDQASFPGLTKQPQIFDAKSTIDELRAPAPAN